MLKKRLFIISALLGLFGAGSINAEKYVGGDISELPTMENAGSKYYDTDRSVIKDLIVYSAGKGMNTMRVRLFVDPDYYIANVETADPYACQSYEYIEPICKRIKEAGMKLLLDFHYSDTWADPVKQFTPHEWTSLNDEQLASKIYDYTGDVLRKLKAAGAEPDFIQTGNEISYGMCWAPYGSSSVKKAYFNTAMEGTNAVNIARFGNLLTNAIKACRDVCPDAKIVLHSERTPQPGVLTNFYDWAASLDYDIIGLSYYFYYHGRLSALEDALYALEAKKYGKDIWIVETGAALNYSVGDSDKQFYDITDAGQNQFATELLTTLDKHPSVNGLFWWEMDYNAYPYSTTQLNNWYNASLFDNNTGKVTSAFATIAGWSGYVAENPGNSEVDLTKSDFYLLYNSGGEWKVPGTKFEKDSNGLFKLKNIHIYQEGENYGWFALTTTTSTDWDVIDAYRYGPQEANSNPLVNDVNIVEENTNSWQVTSGYYNITFDASKMTLSVKEYSEADDKEEEDKGTGSQDNQSGNESGDPEDATQPDDSSTPGEDSVDQDVTQQPSEEEKPGDQDQTGNETGDGDEVQQPGDSDTSQEGEETEDQDTPQQPEDSEQPGEPDNNPDQGEEIEQPGDTGEDNDSENTFPEDSDSTIDDAGVVGIEAETSCPEFFTLQGVKVKNPKSGLYIMVLGGKTQKILIRN